jgi:hypothetical protein
MALNRTRKFKRKQTKVQVLNPKNWINAVDSKKILFGSNIFRLEYLSVYQIPVFRYGLLMRNRGCVEFDTLENSVVSYVRNIMRVINFFLQKFRT